MGQLKEAVPLAERALAIREQELGATHPDTAGSMWNLGLLLCKTDDLCRAQQLLERLNSPDMRFPHGLGHAQVEQVLMGIARRLDQQQARGGLRADQP